MNEIKLAKQKAKEMIALYPKAKNDIMEAYEMFIEEIEDDGSPSHELELFLINLETIKQNLNRGKNVSKNNER